MDKFHFIVIYEQCENISMILAIFHTNRNPINLLVPIDKWNNGENFK